MIPHTLILAIENKNCNFIEAQLGFITNIDQLKAGPRQDPLFTYVARTNENVYQCVTKKIRNLGGEIKDFLNKPCQFELSEKGYYPLHIATSYGLSDLLPIMIEDGADVNQLSELENEIQSKRTPLQIAAMRKSFDCFFKLIQKNGDWNKLDSKGGQLANYFDPFFHQQWFAKVNHILINDFSFYRETGETLEIKIGSHEDLTQENIAKVCSRYFKDYTYHTEKRKQWEENAIKMAVIISPVVEESISPMEKIFRSNVDNKRELQAMAFIKKQTDPAVLKRLLAYVEKSDMPNIKVEIEKKLV